MSYWTYINGNITVSPMGRTQAEKRYILETVLEHLPVVKGSEGSMNVYIIQKNGYDHSSSADEFGDTTNNLVDSYGNKSRRRGHLETQSEYIIVINGNLRDKRCQNAFKEFTKWLIRLAKRVQVEDVLVNISDGDKEVIMRDQNSKYRKLYDMTDNNWCEYLMWSKAEIEE